MSWIFINYDTQSPGGEPTSALDATIQAHLLELLKSMIADLSGAVTFITHDFGILAQLCDKVCVMNDGRIVESGTVAEVFAAPQHEYTRTCCRCAGPRPGPGRAARSDREQNGGDGVSEQSAAGTTPLLQLETVQKTYPVAHGLSRRMRREARRVACAVDEVSLTINNG